MSVTGAVLAMAAVIACLISALVRREWRVARRDAPNREDKSCQ